MRLTGKFQSRSTSDDSDPNLSPDLQASTPRIIDESNDRPHEGPVKWFPRATEGSKATVVLILQPNRADHSLFAKFFHTGALCV